MLSISQWCGVAGLFFLLAVGLFFMLRYRAQDWDSDRRDGGIDGGFGTGS